MFSPVKELTISDVLISSEQQWIDGLLELAKERDRQGKPFERLTVRAWGVPTAVTERLREWALRTWTLRPSGEDSVGDRTPTRDRGGSIIGAGPASQDSVANET